MSVPVFRSRTGIPEISRKLRIELTGTPVELMCLFVRSYCKARCKTRCADFCERATHISIIIIIILLHHAALTEYQYRYAGAVPVCRTAKTSFRSVSVHRWAKIAGNSNEGSVTIGVRVLFSSLSFFSHPATDRSYHTTRHFLNF